MPVVYDCETYPNFFSLATVGLDTDNAALFEVSPRRNDLGSLVAWLHYLAQNRIEMIGFNNEGFDYPLLHLILQNPQFVTTAALYDKAMSIIKSGDRFVHIVWASDRFIPQIDLFKIHHFDNVARATSLKALQFNMRSESVEDLPFPSGTVLTSDQMDIVRAYNMHDTTETKAFAHKSRDQIEFRRQISQRYGRDFMNANDTKIGKEYFIMRLEESRPGSCYQRGTNGGRQPVQTYRSEIRLRDVILPYIRFNHPEFIRVWTWFVDQTISDTRGAITDLSCVVDGFTFHFGTGGVHGSVTRRNVVSDADHAIIDLDVTSFYPSIAIVNRLYPAHLGELFCEIYTDVMRQRLTYPKGSAENAMLKLALNGVYGDSNNIYSPFYDPQYTMSITINGQLLLCMLAERLMATVPGLEMIQINTDGLTVRVPRAVEWLIKEACEWWEGVTRLTLEESRYRQMFIRDVNNYLAVSESGKIKRKGAYESADPDKRAPLGWHQDCSALIVPKAAEAVITGEASSVEEFIKWAPAADPDNPFDFMLRAKAPKGSHLTHGDATVSGMVRYYVARNGAPLTKLSPPTGPLGQYKPGQGVSDADYRAWHAANGNVWNSAIHTKNKSTYENRKMSICAGWNVALCNRADRFDWSNVNFDWYIGEAKKLLE